MRVNGKVYEALVARAQRQASRDLYHAALVAELLDWRTTVEVGPYDQRNRLDLDDPQFAGLARAISGRGAFRRFKDTLSERPDLMTRWCD